MRRLQVLVLAALVCLGLVPAQAATVVLARPVHPSPALTETLFRLYGELLSAGLEVTMVELPNARRSVTHDGRGRWQELAGADRADAVIEIVGDAVPLAVDIHIVGGGSRKPEEARVAVEPDSENASGRLAIRALEVLRSSFVELNLGTRHPPTAPGAKVTSPPGSTTVVQADRPMNGPRRFGIAAGAAVLTSVDSIRVTILPFLRLEWTATERLALQATLAGLGSGPTIATAAGTADVSQGYALVGGSLRLGARPSLRPFVALSAGLLRTTINGQATPPWQGHDEVRWSFLAEGSLGTVVPLGSRFYTALAAHAQLATPYVTVHFDDAVVATLGRPNLGLTLAFGAWL